MSLPSLMVGGTIMPGDFEIVIVRGGGSDPTADPTTAGRMEIFPCSPILRIDKKKSVKLPNKITLQAYVSEVSVGIPTIPTVSTIVIDHPKDFFNSLHPYVVFEDLLSNKVGLFQVTYIMTVETPNDERQESAMESYKFKTPCGGISMGPELKTHDNSYVSSMKNLSIFPTPCRTHQEILYELAEGTHIDISIFDMQGRVHKTLKNEYHEKGVYLKYVDTSALPVGTYFYRIRINDMSFNYKFVKI